MEKKKSMYLTIIAVATLLVMTIGATFAYFAVTSTTANSTSTIETTTTAKHGVVTLTTENAGLKINLTAEDMSNNKKGTNYYSVPISSAESYEASGTLREIAVLGVTGGEDDTVYRCTFNLNIITSGVPSGIQTGDLKLNVGGDILTLSNVDLSVSANQNIRKYITTYITGNNSLEISAYTEVDNRNANQNYLANQTITTTFSTNNLSCDVVASSSATVIDSLTAVNASAVNNTTSNEMDVVVSTIPSSEATTLRNELASSAVGSSLTTEQINNALMLDIDSEETFTSADVTIDVSGYASSGDTVVLYHKNGNTWEVIGTYLVDSNNTITGTFTSFSPISIVKIADILPIITASDNIASGSAHSSNYTLTISSNLDNVTYYYGTSSDNITTQGNAISVTDDGTYYAKACNGVACTSTVSYVSVVNKSCTVYCTSTTNCTTTKPSGLYGVFTCSNGKTSTIQSCWYGSTQCNGGAAGRTATHLCTDSTSGNPDLYNRCNSSLPYTVVNGLGLSGSGYSCSCS